MYKKIFLATDGSPTADKALAELQHLVQPGTQVLVVTIIDNPSVNFAAPYGVSYDIDAVWHALREQGEAVVKHTHERLDQLKIPAEVRLVDLRDHPGRDIASAIEAEAFAWCADLIVLGTHGRRGFRRMLLGSVAEQVLRQTQHPILLVRAEP